MTYNIPTFPNFHCADVSHTLNLRARIYLPQPSKSKFEIEGSPILLKIGGEIVYEEGNKPQNFF